jgi:hypothetical protein
MAAFAILFLAVVSSVIVTAAAGSARSAALELDRTRASEIATAGLEWALATDGAEAHSFGGGSFRIVRGPGRRVRSTGLAGSAVRVAVIETTLIYVPRSRVEGTSNQHVTFEVFNKTGADLDLRGLQVEPSRAAYFEEVRLRVFADLPAAAGVDYGVVWNYARDGGGARAGTGTPARFPSSVIVAAGRQALVEIDRFKAGVTGRPAGVVMDPHELRVEFLEPDPANVGATRALPATAVPRVLP